MTDIRMVSAVLCDEIRREIDDAAIIVGARQSALIFERDGRYHADRLGLYMEFEAENPSADKIQVRLHNRDEDYSIFDQEFPIVAELPDDISEDADLRGVIVVATSKSDVSLDHLGEYFLQYRLGKGRWNTVRSYIFHTPN